MIFALIICVSVILASCGKSVCEHAYDHDCDTECNVCGEEREITHNYSSYTTNIAKHVKICSVCGESNENTREEHEFNEDHACVCGYTLIHIRIYNVGGSYVDRLVSPDGKNISRRYYNADGVLTDQRDYFYDESGNEIHAEDIGTDILNTGKQVYFYDEQGRKIREEQ